MYDTNVVRVRKCQPAYNLYAMKLKLHWTGIIGLYLSENGISEILKF